MSRWQPKRSGRPTKREEQQTRNGTWAFYGMDEFVKELPPVRTRKKSDPKDPRLEKNVLAEVLKALRHDPRVASVERTQSGVFREGDRYIRVGTPGKLDITGMLVGGRTFEIECKRPGKEPDHRQANRIEAIRKNGGVSGYCWSAESALALLP